MGDVRPEREEKGLITVLGPNGQPLLPLLGGRLCRWTLEADWNQNPQRRTEWRLEAQVDALDPGALRAAMRQRLQCLFTAERGDAIYTGSFMLDTAEAIRNGGLRLEMLAKGDIQLQEGSDLARMLPTA